MSPPRARLLGVAALAFASLALQGCHLTNEYEKTPDPSQKVVLQSLLPGPIALGNVDAESVSVCTVEAQREVTTYVLENKVSHGVAYSGSKAWTDEHAGFRMTYWMHEEHIFPCILWGEETFTKDKDFGLFLIWIYGVLPVTACMDLGGLLLLPVLDGMTTFVLAIVDGIPGALSAPFVLATSDGSPPPRTEVLSVDHPKGPAASLSLEWKVDLPSTPGGHVTTSSTGELVLPLGTIVSRALASGHAPLRIEIASEGVKAEVALSAVDLVAIERGRRGGGSAAIAFWRRVLEGVPAPAAGVRQAIGAELARLGLHTGVTDAQALAAVGTRGGVACLADGVEVDWSAGTPSLAPRARAEVQLDRGEVVAGTPVALALTVTNEGKGALFRVLGHVRSEAFATTDDNPVLFGRIDPGATVVRHISLATPITRRADDFDVAVDFAEANEYAPVPVRARVRVVAADRPVLALSARAIDDGSGTSVGNGDGVVQRGEAIDYRIAVKNTGTAPAVNVSLALGIEDQPGVAVFGQREWVVKALAPGEVFERTINISVKPSFAGKAVPVRARVTESSPFATTLSDDLTLRIDEKAPRTVIALDKTVAVLKRSPLLNAAGEDARPLGAVDEGSRLRAVGELDAFVQVEYGDPAAKKRAWLRRSDVTFDLAEARAPVVASGTAAVVREFVKAPPVVVFGSPAEGRATDTGEEDILVRVTIKSEEGLRDVKLLLNDAEVAAPAGGTRGIGGVQRAPVEPSTPGASPRKVATVDERVHLVAGDNRIAVEATDASGEKTRAEVLVRRSVREPVVAALVVGIDHYEDAEIPALRYAEADARSVAEFLRGPRSPVKNPENVKLLVGAEATGRAVRDALEKHLIALAAHPEDMAIFYFAGHGFSEGERYYLASADTRLASLRATGLKLSDLQDYWRDVKAERKVFLADACHSGGLRNMRGDNAISVGLRQSLEGKGKILIAASRDKQQSCESEALGHGVFTSALLDGLGGKADSETGNHDGRVTVRELVSYLEREVPALARKEGHEQNPNYEISEGEGEVFLSR